MSQYNEDDLINQLSRTPFSEVYDIYLNDESLAVVTVTLADGGFKMGFSNEDLITLKQHGWRLEEFIYELDLLKFGRKSV